MDETEVVDDGGEGGVLAEDKGRMVGGEDLNGDGGVRNVEEAPIHVEGLSEFGLAAEDGGVEGLGGWGSEGEDEEAGVWNAGQVEEQEGGTGAVVPGVWFGLAPCGTAGGVGEEDRGEPVDAGTGGGGRGVSDVDEAG